MPRPLKMYFLEEVRLGGLTCVIANRPPKRKGWKVLRSRPLDPSYRFDASTKAETEKVLQAAFGAGASWGRNNFN